MFTGLIEHLGTICARADIAQGCRLTVDAGPVCTGLAEGDSVAVDGVCLTAFDIDGGRFAADVSPETLARTSLGACRVGTAVNLERPLAVGARLGGHFVQGHVDGVTRELARRDEGEFMRVAYALPADLRACLVEKGSVALNGVSLTVASLERESFDVQLVPHTLEATNLVAANRAEMLNLEVDILGKYVARYLDERYGIEAPPVPGRSSEARD